jgi:hypothetical protein
MGDVHQRRIPRSGIRLSGGLARIIRIPSGGEKRRIREEYMTRPRAADDFETIRARMEELRRERAYTSTLPPSKDPRAEAHVWMMFGNSKLGIP